LRRRTEKVEEIGICIVDKEREGCFSSYCVLELGVGSESGEEKLRTQ